MTNMHDVHHCCRCQQTRQRVTGDYGAGVDHLQPNQTKQNTKYIQRRLHKQLSEVTNTINLYFEGIIRKGNTTKNWKATAKRTLNAITTHFDVQQAQTVTMMKKQQRK